MVPGVTQQYASAFEFGGMTQAVLVTSYEGRPIKIDGVSHLPAPRRVKSHLLADPLPLFPIGAV